MPRRPARYDGTTGATAASGSVRLPAEDLWKTCATLVASGILRWRSECRALGTHPFPETFGTPFRIPPLTTSADGGAAIGRPGADSPVPCLFAGEDFLVETLGFATFRPTVLGRARRCAEMVARAVLSVAHRHVSAREENLLDTRRRCS